ncbi:hypothetical protein CRG98_023769 [Punica granatum]|uniref:Uncharacterized protein n=1 Tax=Punica granatum TaxID=22663 RepID=A0A2I0JHU7_PUNGR|nr:hypothetical protein CRG98_023769 [Punica granatum]
MTSSTGEVAKSLRGKRERANRGAPFPAIAPIWETVEASGASEYFPDRDLSRPGSQELPSQSRPGWQSLACEMGGMLLKNKDLFAISGSTPK